jgi:hypothetical protein
MARIRRQDLVPTGAHAALSMRHDPMSDKAVE